MTQAKDFTALVAWLRSAGWRVDLKKGKKGYPVAYCPCPGGHKGTIHRTPSDPNYWMNRQKWFDRQCGEVE